MIATHQGVKNCGDIDFEWWVFPPMTEEQFLEMREEREDWQYHSGGPGAFFRGRAVARMGKYRTLVTVRSGMDV